MNHWMNAGVTMGVGKRIFQVIVNVLYIVLACYVSGTYADNDNSYEIISLGCFASGRLDGLCFDQQGNLLLACEGDSKLIKLSPEGHVTVLMDASDGLKQPEDVVVDAENNIFISDDAARAVFKIMSDGTVQKYLDSQDGLIQPEGMVFDSHGNMFLADEEAHVIYKITKDKVIDIFVDYTAGFITPEDLAIDSNDNLYVVDDDGGSLLRISPNKDVEVLLTRDDGFFEPEGIALYGTDVFISDSMLNIIFTYSLSTGRTSIFFDVNQIDGIHGLQGIAVSNKGTVYASFGRGKILKFIDQNSFH